VLAYHLNPSSSGSLYDLALCTRLCTIPLLPSYNISYKLSPYSLLDLLGQIPSPAVLFCPPADRTLSNAVLAGDLYVC
jgi:hypothetical protein